MLDRARSRPGKPHLSHRTFRELGEELRSGDLLVTNDSKVIAARLAAQRDTGGAAEVLVLRPMAEDAGRWETVEGVFRRLRVSYDRVKSFTADV